MSLIRITSRFVGQSCSSPLHKNFSSNKTLGSASTALLLGVSGSKNPNLNYWLGNGSCATNSSQLNLNLCNKYNNHGIILNQTRKMGTLKRQPSVDYNKIKKDNMQPKKSTHGHLATTDITKNIMLFTDKPESYEFDSKTLRFKKPSGNPLVVIMSWLLAKPKHLKVYADIYVKLGFDVVAVSMAPWQLLWPTKGTQLVAEDALKFLENNSHYSQIVVHGFSVGGYQFGEIMVHMSKDMNRYQPILDKITCQIWDSAADITEIPIGVPKAIFPRNMRLQNALRNYTLYHLKTFHNQATIHYMRSSQLFHSTLVRSPALFLVSKNDLIGPERSNLKVKEHWEQIGIKLTFKCWDHSGHVAHLIHHREEYLSYLYKHLEEANMIDSMPQQQSRAKL